MDAKFFILTGRPNAGKSSLIRQVLGLNVRSGKRPGTTRRISQYPMNSGLFLVDMPGFGRMDGVAKRFEEKAKSDILNFLEANAQNIVLALHVLDISTFIDVTLRLEKKGFLSLDVEMIQFLLKILGTFPLVAANKIDKTDSTRLEISLAELLRQLGNDSRSSMSECIFPVSTKTGQGLGTLKSAIHEQLVVKGYNTPFKINAIG